MREPTSHPNANPAAPDQKWEIDFVYGYKSEDARMNLHYNIKGQPVYMTAALGIILDPKARTQKFFGGGEVVE